jgi:hypothetical protein
LPTGKEHTTAVEVNHPSMLDGIKQLLVASGAVWNFHR